MDRKVIMGKVKSETKKGKSRCEWPWNEGRKVIMSKVKSETKKGKPRCE